MKFKRIITFAIIALMIGGSAMAQPHGKRKGKRQHGDRKEMRERIETIKLVKLTEILALDEDQSARFFPRYRDYNDAKKESFKEMRDYHNALEDAIKAGQEDSEIKKLMKKIFEFEAKQMKKDQEFVESMDDILTRTQMAKLMMFEHRFHKRMHELVRDMVAPPPPPFHDGYERAPLQPDDE